MKIIVRLIACVCICLLSGCSSHDEAYYSRHPQAVFTALQTCATGGQVLQVSCQDIEEMAQTFRKWVSELQADPQSFGQQIMRVQLRCAQKSLSAVESKNCRNELDMRLAVVKWLESPES